MRWKVVDVDRTVDISSQIVKITAELTLENGGASHATSVDIILKLSNHLIYFLFYSWPILNYAFSFRFVVYQGTVLFPSAYTVVKERTIVRTGTGKIISATALAPSKQESDRVIYGPYYNSPPFNTKIIKIHYENNGPFVVATTVERRIEISHWGNIAVEDYIELVHKGAQLKVFYCYFQCQGSFSRLDYQMDRRGRRQPTLQYFTTILPASAKDIYYRDEIGNISTSAVRVRADSVDVEIKPRSSSDLIKVQLKLYCSYF
uniref:Dolichyl-diphosphooligosaccharide--protein glycosyltransferase subunit 1 n=1 Tax=Heterorhabditis bacteriophora TaxID=37862 RepID=A0A1I7W677_HETBA